MWSARWFNVTYSESVHILLDCLRYYNQAESNRFVGYEPRTQLRIQNAARIADCHKAPDTIDSKWQCSGSETLQRMIKCLPSTLMLCAATRKTLYINHFSMCLGNDGWHVKHYCLPKKSDNTNKHFMTTVHNCELQVSWLVYMQHGHIPLVEFRPGSMAVRTWCSITNDNSASISCVEVNHDNGAQNVTLWSDRKWQICSTLQYQLHVGG